MGVKVRLQQRVGQRMNHLPPGIRDGGSSTGDTRGRDDGRVVGIRVRLILGMKRAEGCSAISGGGGREDLRGGELLLVTEGKRGPRASRQREGWREGFALEMDCA
jgi:hypothetical protein